MVPCPQRWVLYIQCMHDQDGYELMHIARDPSHWYAERWGHTLGFKAAGSLSVHTTVAVWNAHHALEIRAKTPQSVKSICKLKTVHIARLSLNVILAWERTKKRTCKTGEERKC